MNRWFCRNEIDTTVGERIVNRKTGSVLSLIFVVLLTLWPNSGFSQAQSKTDAKASGSGVRRDLGEKGKIVIDSLDLYDTDIESVVRLLARVAGINIITGAISGSVSVYLENVTVEDALNAILASQGYAFIYDGNIVRVVDAAQVGEDRVQTITETFVLNYLPAEKVADTLRSVFQSGQLGGNVGQIEANVEANAVIAIDTPSRMEDIRRMIDILDRRLEQVEIEGRFVEITYKQEQDWGVDWKYFQDPANTADVHLAPQVLDSPAANGQFKFAIIRGQNNLTGFLQMLETDNDIKVLASPKTLAVENKEAIIELTNEIPFVEANVSQGVITESVQFQETGIRLIVTPKIAEEADGTYVTMKLELEQRIAGPNVVLQNSIAFPIDSRRAETTLVAPDESTIVIGGLKSNDQTYTYEKVPFFGSIPVLGLPFHRRTKKENQTELMLFVTPRVIYEPPPLDNREMTRHDELDKVMDGLNTQADWKAGRGPRRHDRQGTPVLLGTGEQGRLRQRGTGQKQHRKGETLQDQETERPSPPANHRQGRKTERRGRRGPRGDHRGGRSRDRRGARFLDCRERGQTRKQSHIRSRVV